MLPFKLRESIRLLGYGPNPVVGLGLLAIKTFYENTIQKLHSRLSKWKVKTLSVGGRLTLLKSVLGSSPLYNMSIYKVPKGVLHDMESIRSKFFNGADLSERKITWVAWDRVLASKKNGGLGVSSFHALNRALLLKWVWRFISQDGSIWSRVIRAIYGTSIDLHSTKYTSNWCSILREVQVLSSKGFDFVSRCKKRVGNGCNTRFWLDIWVLDCPLSIRFPRIFALEIDKEVSVSVKMGANSIVDSFRRPIRDGVERQQWGDLSSILDTISLSSANDRWSCDVNGDSMFRVKDIRSSLDDIFLPSSVLAMRWVKYIPIKINIFIWRARLDCLPTRSNLANRGVVLDSLLCPICGSVPEDASHFLFQCGLSKLVFCKICWWWDLVSNDMSSFSDWDVLISGIRLPLLKVYHCSSRCVPISVSQDPAEKMMNSVRMPLRQIMRKISSWWNIDYSDVNSYEEWQVWLVSIRIQSKLKGVLEGVYYGLWWYMWNFRNKLLFDKKIPEKAQVFDNLVSSSFYWCKFRCKAPFKWDDWLKNPYIVLV
ncbi:RNA-directed DNA polymerase, eukaryota [Tanacetum coccineum]